MDECPLCGGSVFVVTEFRCVNDHLESTFFCRGCGFGRSSPKEF